MSVIYIRNILLKVTTDNHNKKNCLKIVEIGILVEYKSKINQRLRTEAILYREFSMISYSELKQKFDFKKRQYEYQKNYLRFQKYYGKEFFSLAQW